MLPPGILKGVNPRLTKSDAKIVMQPDPSDPVHDNSCSHEAFILSWAQPGCQSQIKDLDFSNASQCKISIQGQMEHVKLGLPKPDVTQVSVQNILHIKVSKHLF